MSDTEIEVDLYGISAALERLQKVTPDQLGRYAPEIGSLFIGLRSLSIVADRHHKPEAA